MICKSKYHEDMKITKKSTKIVFDDLSRQVVDAAYQIHQVLGTGLLRGYERLFGAIEENLWLMDRRSPSLLSMSLLMNLENLMRAMVLISV